MKKLSRFTLILSMVGVACSSCNTGKKVYTPADAHSHNDYKNSIPFFRAYNDGFGSIEADVYPVNGQLMVAHEEDEITPSRSLKILYIDPLIEKLKQDTTRELRLLIEIKKNYVVTLPLVVKELQPLSKYFAYPNHPGRLSIVMTGEVPPAEVMGNYPDWMRFDVDHIDGFTKPQLIKIGLFSFPFGRYSKWDGVSAMSNEDEHRLRGIIDSVHADGKKIRFWGIPDTPTCWRKLTKLHVDVIGTDHVDELADFLKRKIYLDKK